MGATLKVFISFGEIVNYMAGKIASGQTGYQFDEKCPWELTIPVEEVLVKKGVKYDPNTTIFFQKKGEN